MKLTAIKLRFIQATHFSRGRENSYDSSQTILHSDTLKSALFVTLRQFGKNLTGDFFNQFRISSAFPFQDYNTPTGWSTRYFFPKPTFNKLPLEMDIREGEPEETSQDKQEIKRIRKIQFVDHLIFEKLLKGEKVILGPNYLSENGKLATLIPFKDDSVKVFTKVGHQHVKIATVDKYAEQRSTPFFMEKLFFEKNAGLFFLLQTEDEIIKNEIISAVKILADSGIGTDKHTGHGHFNFDPSEDVQKMSFDINPKLSHQTNLSLYCPLEEEIKNLQESYFQLIKRGGFIASPASQQHLALRKKSIYMFEEGGIFPFYPNRIGKVTNLEPDHEDLRQAGKTPIHPIWRDGTALFFPCVKL